MSLFDIFHPFYFVFEVYGGAGPVYHSSVPKASYFSLYEETVNTASHFEDVGLYYEVYSIRW